MTLEEQIKRYKELAQKIEELERQKKALGVDILEQMTDKTLRIADYLVRHCSRLSIKLSITEARSLNATKMEETIDRDKIKSLYQLGNPIQGVSESHFIQVSQLPKSS